MGDWTRPILFVGLFHVLRRCFIGQLFTIRLLLSGILGVVRKRLLLAIIPRDWSKTGRNEALM